MRSVVNSIKQSELILRAIPRFNQPMQFEKSFTKYLQSLKDRQVNTPISKDLFIFPLDSFQIFSKPIIKNLISNSYTFLKEQNLLKVNGYNIMLMSYITYNVDIDATSVLKDMRTINLIPDKITYSYLITLSANKGDFKSMLMLMDAMKVNKFEFNEKLNSVIYEGFLRAGKFDEAKKFINDYNINENNFNLLISSAKVYAEMNKFNDVLNVIKKIEGYQNKIKLMIVQELYPRLMKAGASDSELDQILELANCEKRIFYIIKLIYTLARDGFYDDALNIFLKFREDINNINAISNIALSFMSRDCPDHIYKKMLESAIYDINYTFNSLFLKVDFDWALKLTESNVDRNKMTFLISNLLNLAFTNKSLAEVETTLKYAYDVLDLNKFNTMMQFAFIPLSLESGFTANCESLIELLPEFKLRILHAIYMNYLCSGNFTAFKSLLEKYPYNQLDYLNLSRTNAKNILNNISINELEILETEASKVFNRKFIEYLMAIVITEKMIQSSLANDIGGMNDAIKISKKLNVTFSPNTFNYVKKNIRHYEYLDQLKVVGVVKEDSIDD